MLLALIEGLGIMINKMMVPAEPTHGPGVYPAPLSLAAAWHCALCSAQCTVKCGVQSSVKCRAVCSVRAIGASVLTFDLALCFLLLVSPNLAPMNNSVRHN